MESSKLRKFLTPFLSRMYPNWFAFIIIFGAMLWLNMHRSDFIFYGDAGGYWHLAKTFEDPTTGIFSFLNFTSMLRGYLFPFVLYLIIKSSAFLGLKDVILLEVIQAFVLSCLVAIIVPATLKKLFNNEIRFWQILLLGFLMIFFWQGYLFYPLSDIWALLFFIFGIYLFLCCGGKKWALFFAGASFGGAALIRPSYAITLIFLLFWAAYYFLSQNQTKKQIFANELIIVFGLAFIFLPQLEINKARFGVLSPMPLMKSSKDGGNLFQQQLTWGIQMQRRDAVVAFAKPKLQGWAFVDQHGRNILIQSGFDPDVFFYSQKNILTLSEYFLLVRKHPLDFSLIYVRHLFNGLDIVYNTPYVYNLENTVYIRLLNYSLWFLAVLYISKCVKISAVITRQFLLLLIFVLPSILSVPTAVEVRFMLPFYFILYSMISFFILPTFFLLFGKEKKINILVKYLPWYGIFIIVCFLLSINTFVNNVFVRTTEHIHYIFW